MAWKRRGKLSAVLLAFQALFVVLFAVFVDYDDSGHSEKHNAKDTINNVDVYYGMFQDVHVMIFIGFGFLMTFLRQYGFSSVGINFLMGAFMLQWATLVTGFFHMSDHHWRIAVDIKTMLLSDFAAAAVLISMGANLGKLSPIQYIVMAFVEIVIFGANEWLGLDVMRTTDAGGSMFVHVFGAYFGLAVSRVLHTSDIEGSAAAKESSNYHSDLFSMIGTVFLWIYWPSFNGALSLADDRHRVVVNTYYALAACCVVSFAVSAAVDKHDKLDMVHIQNATLAGGVAVGTAADMMIFPYGAILIGSAAGALSVLGYKYLTPWINRMLKVHDTCGVNNLHGMPGLMAGIAGAIGAATATEKLYGHSLYEQFSARAPTINTTEYFDLKQKFPGLEAGLGRSASEQAGWQMIALIVTFFVAIVGGILTGFLLKLPIWNQPFGEELLEDEPFWGIPDEGYPLGFAGVKVEPKLGHYPANGFHDSMDTITSKVDPSVTGSQQMTLAESTHV